MTLIKRSKCLEQDVNNLIPPDASHRLQLAHTQILPPSAKLRGPDNSLILEQKKGNRCLIKG